MDRGSDDEVLRSWANAGLYRFSPDPRKETFSCVLPCPNATGQLHLGHALNLSIQDVLCRSHRREGREILWAGALDHGSSSTQTVVERRMRAAKGDHATRDVREVERAIRAWIAEISPQIYEQFRQFGVLMDMDPPASMWDPGNVELTVGYFLELYAKGLIYEAEATTDWCPRCKTALDEIEQVESTLEETVFTLRYRAVDSDAVALDVPTSAPEILHTAVALVIAKSDGEFERHRGRLFRTAFGQPIPVLVAERKGDESNTALVTPAHCAFSARLAKLHGLDAPPAFDASGVMLDGPFAGKTREEARELGVALLAKRGALVRRERVTVTGSVCKRCSTPVEAYRSRQWFLRVEPLLEPTLKLLEQGRVRIHPRRYESFCKAWLSGQIDARRRQSCDDLVDDWCIGRQIQCGPRIPMSRCACGRVAVGRERLPCRACGGTTLPVDDVIDLKLGDALWPFCANQRYAKDAGNLAEIGTRAACVTGLDLLFYWIMPIVMLSTTLDDPLPFRDVVIHPLVCDKNGNKMGKSVGNVVVPSEIVARYGADCLRLSLFDGLDLFEEKLFFSDEKLERNRQWLGRLVAAAETLMSRGDSGSSSGPSGSIADLENAFRIAIDGYRLSELHAIACTAIERLERACKRETNVRDTTLGDVLALLHPLAPLTTESLWGRAFPREGLLAAYVTPSKREPEAGRRKAV